MPLRAEHDTRIGGLGPPPHTVTFVTDAQQLTVVDVPGDTLDLVRLLDAPEGRPGNLIELPLRLRRPGTVDLVAIVDDQIVTASADHIALPADRPADLWGVWRRDGRPTGLVYRHLATPGVWAPGVELQPTIALDGAIDIELPRSPTGWVQAELTVDGLRTGLILGEGLAGPGAAVRVARPSQVDVPTGGLWLTAQAPDHAQAAHVPLDTPAAGLAWPDDPAISPRPGPIDAGAIIARDRPRLQWQATPGLLRADFEITDGCTTDTWSIVAPADTGSLDLPLPPGRDPLRSPLLLGNVRVDRLADASYAARLSGALGPAAAAPTHSARQTVLGRSGAWRAGTASCTASPVQGTWYVEPTDAACDPSADAQQVIVDRCGNLIPVPADPGLCGAISGSTVALRAGGRLRLRRDGDGWLLGDRLRLRPPLDGGMMPPPELIGDWFRARVSEQVHEPEGDGPGVPRDSEVVLAVADPRGGPWAELTPSGRLTVRLDARPLEAILQSFDGVTARFLVEGRLCSAEPRVIEATFDADQLVIEEWLADRAVLRRWRLGRR